MESDTKKVNSIGDLYKITMSCDPIKEIIEILVYNSAENTPLTGTYKLNCDRYQMTTTKINAEATEQEMNTALS